VDLLSPRIRAMLIALAGAEGAGSEELFVKIYPPTTVWSSSLPPSLLLVPFALGLLHLLEGLVNGFSRSAEAALLSAVENSHVAEQGQDGVVEGTEEVKERAAQEQREK
jgi:hypothetical protein